MAYDHKKIEEEARKKWAELSLYECDLTDETKEPYYLLVEFPYPSGDLHTGHWYAFAVTDIYARMLRARGKNVLFPMGFDAFGLPAENAAIRNNVDPAAWTRGNIERMKGQLAAMGASFDWSKEVVACDPSYYHWTQWLFSKLFEHGLAERREAAVKWCPKDQTVLANEQVIDGRCERCGTEVVERILTQWFLKITQYADRLLKNLDALPWREEIKEAQRAWIGKSEGAYLDFALTCQRAPLTQSVRVFTTRPDTLYGATYLVLAPEHGHVGLTMSHIENQEEVGAYIEQSKKKTERERSENKDKTGVELKGIKAINPATKEEIPIFIADYVLGSYGTGAIMAVPAHDERDYEFATKHKVPMRQVVAPRYYQTTEPGAYRSQEPTTEKDGVIVLIKHWKDKKYLGLKWKEVAWGTLLTGGVDEGLTPEETVIKEIREETGFLHPKIVRKLGVVDGIFYHVPKQKNQHVHGHMFYVELEDGEQEAVSEEEAAKHELVWLTPAKLDAFLTPETHHHALRLFNGERAVYTGDGSLVDSGEFTGALASEAMWEIVAAVAGERTTQYRLRDWLVSRQRYWGCPIPIVYDPEGTPHMIPAEHLPWLLPTDVDFTPTGEAPLASSKELKERVTRIFGEGWRPEYDTLDTFVDSSWYFTRYLDPKDERQFSDMAMMKKWLPVNRYSGGAEHTTLHLLYSRFFTMALYDLALVPVEEPYQERFNRGIILGPDGAKMSKSKGNVINPDELVGQYGADAVRIYLAFIGPYGEPGSYPWQLDGVASMRKFLDRVARVVEKHKGNEGGVYREALERQLAKAAHKVATDGDRFKFNTGIAALMTLLNELEKAEDIPRNILAQLLVVLAPFAPHITEHLWAKLSEASAERDSVSPMSSVHQQPWPQYDPTLLVDDYVTIAVQVAGKKRGEVVLAPDASEEEALAAAHALPAVAAALGSSKPSRTIYIPGRILNFVP